MAAKKRTSKKPNYVCRNRSAYNFYYKHQRHIIIENLQNKGSVQKKLQTPQEIEFFLLKTESKQSRKHIKTHGVITLKDLTRTIARRWKETDVSTKAIYKRIAEQDALRYKHEISMGKREVPYTIDSNAKQVDKSIEASKPVTEVLSVSAQPQLIIDEFTPRCIEEMQIQPEIPTENFDSSDCMYYSKLLLEG